MQTTHAVLVRGFAAQATQQIKTAGVKTAARKRWLEDSDLVKLCELCKKTSKKR